MKITKQVAIIALMASPFLFESCKKDSPSPPPVASFSYSGTGVAPATVTFTNTSTGGLTSYFWDFGDNGTSTSENPTHTYVNGGVFTVKLTVTGVGGSTSVTKTLNIQTPTSVKIVGLKVMQMPFTDANGGGWDNNSGPDVYYTITDANNNELASSATYFKDAISSQLPLTFNLTAPYFQITNFSDTYKVILWDMDINDLPPNDDDFIGGYSFNFSNTAQIGYPSTYTLFTTGGNIKIDLSLQWQ
jgi:PKD repeat protein